VGRWAAVIVAILIAAGAGLLAGYVRWGSERPALVESAEPPRSTTESELTTLRAQNRELQARIEQVTREQERLAQENEILHKQQATEQVLGTPGELPALPPK
jgi:hypothetical protein